MAAPDLGPFRPIRETLVALAAVLGHPLALVALVAFAAGWLMSGEPVGWHGVATLAALAATMIIQASENRNAAAIHAKLDELIRVSPEARDQLARLEDRDEAEIEETRVEEAEDLAEIAKDATEASHGRRP